MNQRDRREFLKISAASLASTGLLGAGSAPAAEDKPLALSRELLTADGRIPPHRAILVPGIHAYAEKSVAAGDTIHFRTSSTVPYRLEVCRLAGHVDDNKSDVVLARLSSVAPRQQPLHTGSYIHVAKGLPHDEPLTSFSLECWVRPWRFTACQGILTQHDFPHHCGIGLLLEDKGQITFCLGDGGAYDTKRRLTGITPNHRRWSHLVGTFDGKTATLWVNGRSVASLPISGPVRAGATALRLGAFGKDGAANYFLDGDIALPVIYSRALSAVEIKQRIDKRGQTPPDMKDVLACWPLAEEDGAEVADIGPNKRHGQIINHATWMIGGPSFHSDQVGRYDAAYDPTKDAERGHGLRFAAEDLFDCRWEVTHQYDIPRDAKSGIYVGRFHYTSDGKPRAYQVTFVVRRPGERPKAPIVVLCNSSTWLAYGATPFAPVSGQLQFWSPAGLPNNPTDAPAYCCYRDHAAGQPTYYVGINMPWPSASPDVLYSSPQVGYSHLMRTELFAHRWLDGHYGDHRGYAYDVVTDWDLHRDPELLDGYKTLVINGHSEYWSAPAIEGLDRFFHRGGTAAILSGNTMFWRTSFSADGSVMECRKYDPRIGGRGGATIGELYHSQDKQRGSLARESGYPEWQHIGLASVGWAGTGRGDFRGYEVAAPEHPLFHQPEKVELAKGETFGHGQGGVLPRAVGHEWDVRLSTVRRYTREVPPGATLPAEEPAGIVTLALARRSVANLHVIDYFTKTIQDPKAIFAEMIYWDRPDGGRVFNAGSIGAGWALSADPKLRTLMRNVLAHFGIKPVT